MSGLSKRSRSRSPSDNFVSLLSRVKLSELKAIKISIKRKHFNPVGPELPFRTDIGNPHEICPLVHIRYARELPLFGKDIKVNQEFPDHRRVVTSDHNRHFRRSRSRSRLKSRSRERSRHRSHRSRSRDRDRSVTKSMEKRRRRRSNSSSSSSSSRRRRRSSNRRRSRSRHREDSYGKYRHRDKSHDRYSRSSSPHMHKPSCPMYKETSERRRRSITPLKPGEYRPGHPDLALRDRNRVPPNVESQEGDLQRINRTGPIPRPAMGMGYAFVEGLGPVSLHPVYPPGGFFPRMPYPGMMPRMPMNPRMNMNSRTYRYRPPNIINKPAATVTSNQQPVTNPTTNEDPVSSTERKETSIDR